MLSAYGMGLADQNVIREQAVETLLAPDKLPEIAGQLDALAAAARSELERQQVSGNAVQLRRRVHVRYQGSDSALVVPFGTQEEIVAGFEAAYRQRFSFLMPGKPMIVEAVSVEAIVGDDERAAPEHLPREVPRRETVRMYPAPPAQAAPCVRGGPAARHVIASRRSSPRRTPPMVEPDGGPHHRALTTSCWIDGAARRRFAAAGTQVDPVPLRCSITCS